MLSYDYISEDYMDKVMQFDCGNDHVNDFLKENALELHNCNYCTTKLFFEEDKLLGFISVRLGEISSRDVDIEKFGWIDRLPRSAYYSHKYPIVHIQFLGVDKSYKRHGIARWALLKVFENTYDILENFGCNFIYLDSFLTDEALGLYNDLGFIEIDRDPQCNNAKMIFKIERH